MTGRLATGRLTTARPNVLFLIAHDISLRFGCYGDPRAVTPHLDALAAGGTLFENAFCQFPMCAPARTCLMTGCRPDTVQRYDIGGPDFYAGLRRRLPWIRTLPEAAACRRLPHPQPAQGAARVRGRSAELERAALVRGHRRGARVVSGRLRLPRTGAALPLGCQPSPDGGAFPHPAGRHTCCRHPVQALARRPGRTGAGGRRRLLPGRDRRRSDQRAARPRRLPRGRASVPGRGVLQHPPAVAGAGAATGGCTMPPTSAPKRDTTRHVPRRSRPSWPWRATSRSSTTRRRTICRRSRGMQPTARQAEELRHGHYARGQLPRCPDRPHPGRSRRNRAGGGHGGGVHHRPRLRARRAPSLGKGMPWEPDLARAAAAAHSGRRGRPAGGRSDRARRPAADPAAACRGSARRHGRREPA